MKYQTSFRQKSCLPQQRFILLKREIKNTYFVTYSVPNGMKTTNVIRFRRTNSPFLGFYPSPSCFRRTNKISCEKDQSLFLSVPVSLSHYSTSLVFRRRFDHHHHNRRQQLRLTSTTKYSVCPVSSRTAANRFC